MPATAAGLSLASAFAPSIWRRYAGAASCCGYGGSSSTTASMRVPGRGNYYSSPVGGDGKVYLLSEQGELTVISAKADWEVLHTVDFGEPIFATPALVDGRIYLRTAGHLYCFGEK